MKFYNGLKKTYFILILIILSAPQELLSKNIIKVLIIGDSISAGYGIPLEKHWVNILQNQLNLKEKKILLINASISGDTTSGGLSRLDFLLKENTPNYLLLELGGNDGLRGYPISQIKKNLNTICTESLKLNIPVGLMQIKLPPNYGMHYTQAFEKIYLELAEHKNVTLLPFMLENIALNENLMLADGIHPNEYAQLEIAKLMNESLNLLIQ